MELTFAPKGVLQINDARICFRNFKGAAGRFNAEGVRSFSLIIPDQETADALINDLNRCHIWSQISTELRISHWK